MEKDLEKMEVSEVEALSEALGQEISKDLNKFMEKTKKKLKAYGLTCQMQLSIDKI
jgi:hypothetical protein